MLPVAMEMKKEIAVDFGCIFCHILVFGREVGVEMRKGQAIYKTGDYFYTHHILVVFLLIDGSSQICMNNLGERVEKGGKKALNRCFAKKKIC